MVLGSDHYYVLQGSETTWPTRLGMRPETACGSEFRFTVSQETVQEGQVNNLSGKKSD